MIGGQNIERNSEYNKCTMTFQINSQAREEVLLYVIQTIVTHATSRDIQIDSINIDVEGDVDLRGFTDISNDVPMYQKNK